MKRYITLFSILVVFATMLVGCDVNRMGKDEYYVQITTDAKIKSGYLKKEINTQSIIMNYKDLTKMVMKNSEI